MRKIMMGIVIGTIFLPIIIAATVVYTKNVNEKEQLILGEVRAYLQSENPDADLTQLNVVKPGLFKGYNEWYVKRVDTSEKYQYQYGEVVKIIDSIE